MFGGRRRGLWDRGVRPGAPRVSLRAFHRSMWIIYLELLVKEEKKTLNGQVEDLSAELDLEMTREEEEKWDGDENNHSQVKAQINDVSYLNDLTQSSESASQDGDVFTLRTPCGK